MRRISLTENGQQHTGEEFRVGVCVPMCMFAWGGYLRANNIVIKMLNIIAASELFPLSSEKYNGKRMMPAIHHARKAALPNDMTFTYLPVASSRKCSFGLYSSEYVISPSGKTRASFGSPSIC